MAFSKEWKDEYNEDAEAKSFWDGFFNVFGVPRRRVATFEEKVHIGEGREGYIDLLWKGTILVEHKSRGKSLDRAFQQAKDYFPGIKDNDLPRYILVSDFARFRLYDLDENEQHEFALEELPYNVHLFGFMSGYQRQIYPPQDPVNIKAAEAMGKLHDQLKATRYEGHNLEVYLVRLLFCLFADDTGIFEKNAFREFVDTKTRPDGGDLGAHLSVIFWVLNTPDEKRQTILDESLRSFPYVDGGLFAEQLPPASFDALMRQQLLTCAALDWSRISPAIFGSLFQSVMNAKERRALGAHYTEEKNILKVVRPLFMDDLWEEFERSKNNPRMLEQLHQKIGEMRFFDPACGCGNFLVIAYRELRLLELEILRIQQSRSAGSQLQQAIWSDSLVKVNVDQFYGIEIEEFPAQIAQVAMWLMDHQMNMMVSSAFGQYFKRLPLKASPQIICYNALTMDWKQLIKPEETSFILGNPPFIGSANRTTGQKEELKAIFKNSKNTGVLDYVTAWYVKAAEFIQGTSIKVGFVSTNSITQGEQVGPFWDILINKYKVKIHFAHRTFRWSSEARGKAAVHCVIIGFALTEPAHPALFDYETPDSGAQKINVKRINPYLVDAPDVLLFDRKVPLCDVPQMSMGNKPVDGGYYLFSEDEMKAFIQQEPASEKWFRPWIGGVEFINGYQRYCLWLGDCPPDELRMMPEVMKRIEAVSKFRLESKKGNTRKLAATPTHFELENMPTTSFIVVPETSSERRKYIPIGFMNADVICSNLVRIMPHATSYHFGVLTSSMHMAWVRYVCGRLKSDYRYSVAIVYNNFPWPDPTDKQRTAIENAATGVLEARKLFPKATLADLYDFLTMPSELLQAHNKLDAEVEKAYGKRFSSDVDRVAFLFERHLEIISKGH